MNKSFVVMGGQSDCFDSPVSVVIESPSEFSSIKLLDMDSKTLVPCQWECVENGVVLTWIEPELKRLTSKKYEATFSQDPIESGGAGVELIDTTSTMNGKVDVMVRGSLFTSYRYGLDWQRPFMHPVMGPYEDSITRSFPMEEVPGETRDHPPQLGLYTAHGSYHRASTGNAESFNQLDGTWGWGDGTGSIIHREFSVLENGPVFGHMIAHNEWVSHDNEFNNFSATNDGILSETREIKFYNTKGSYLADYTTTFKPIGGDVLWGDSKYVGMVSIRMATSMDVANGGRLENSFGGINEQECHGKKANWCDYSGPVNDKWVGIALMEHNKSFRHPAYWFARDYGLLASNPFGVNFFEGEGNGSYVLKSDDSITFRYRIYVHAGNAVEANVVEKYNNYVNAPKPDTEHVESMSGAETQSYWDKNRGTERGNK